MTTAATSTSLRIVKILLGPANAGHYASLRPQPAQEPARDVGDDRHLAVARFVLYDPGVPVQSRNPFAVRGVVEIERQRDPPYVQRQARRHGLDQFVNALPLERRNVQCGWIPILQPP